MDDPVRGLHPAGHLDETGAQDEGAVAFEDLRPDDDVGGAGLVLDGHEDDALGRAGPLADQDEAGDRDPAARAQALQPFVGDDPQGLEVAAHEAHRMRLQRQRQEAIIVDHLLADRHRRQRRVGLGLQVAGRRLLEQRQPLRRALGVERPAGPQRVAAAVAQRGEGVGIGQPLDGRAFQPGAQPQVAHGIVARAPRLHQRAHVGFAQALHLPEAETDRVARADMVAHAGIAGLHPPGVEGGGLQRLVPVGAIDVDRPHLDPVLAGVAHDLRRGVEAHRLGVQEGGGEDVRIMAFQPAGGVDQQREGGGVAFGKAVFAEALDLLEAALGEVALVAARDHALDHLLLEGVDGADPPEGRHGAAQPVGLVGREARRDDGDLHRLFLEQRHAEGAAEHLAQFLLGEGDRLQPHLAAQIGVDHVALDRPGPHDRHLDDQVVEAVGPQLGQHGHLRPALDLEDAERVGALDHRIGRLVVLGLRQIGQRQRQVVMLLQEIEGAAQAGQHAQRQDVDLQDAELVEIVLVPLDDGAPLHAGVEDRHHLVDAALGDDEAADMLGQMPRKAGELGGKGQDVGGGGVLGRQARGRGLALAEIGGGIAPDRAGQGRDGILRQAERLADLAGGRPRPIGDDGGGDGGVVAAVMLVDVLDHLLAALVLEVDVDVRRLAPVRGDEALEQEAGPLRRDLGDADAEADDGIGRRAAALAQDALLAGAFHDVMDGEEIRLVLQFADDLQLVVDPRRHAGRHALRIAPAGALMGEMTQLLGRRARQFQRLVGIFVGKALQVELQLGEEPAGLGDRLGIMAEQPLHLVRRLQVPLGIARQKEAGLGQRHMLADRGHHVLQPAPAGRVVEGVVGGQHRRAAARGQMRRPRHAALVEPVMGRRDGQADGAAEGLAQPVQRVGEAGLHCRGVAVLAAAERLRRDHREVQPLAPFQEVGKGEDAASLGRPQIAAAQKPAEPAPAGTVARIGEDVGRRVGKHQPGAGRIGQFRLARGLVGAHDAGHGVAVGNAETGEPQAVGGDHQLLRLRRAGKEGKAAGDADLGKGPGLAIGLDPHAKMPCRNQAGRPSGTCSSGSTAGSAQPWRNSQKRRPASSSTR